MNKTRFIWGIICLCLSGVLAVLILTLPPENLMFTVGDRNMPWVPAVALAIVGVILLALSPSGDQTAGQEKPTEPGIDLEKAALNKRLESIGWGLFLIMLGGFSFVPHEQVPAGIWSLGIGLIMLGLNLARYVYKIRMSGFTTFLGILSVLGGIAELLGYTSLDGAFLLIILGAYLLIKPWTDKHQIFGKSEQGRV